MSNWHSTLRGHNSSGQVSAVSTASYGERAPSDMSRAESNG